MYQHYFFYNYEDEHGCHEVHTKDCRYLPSIENRTHIGYFPDCSSALKDASIQYPEKKFDGCFFCCRECHNG